jgi:transposase
MKEWNKISLTERQKKEIKEAKKQTNKTQLLQRLQCVELKNKHWKHRELEEFFGVCMNTITNWLKAFIEGGIQGLLEWNYKGKQSQLTNEHKEQLKKRHEEKPFDTAKEAKQYIEEALGIEFHLHWVQKLLKKNFDCHTRKQL